MDFPQASQNFKPCKSIWYPPFEIVKHENLDELRENSVWLINVQLLIVAILFVFSRCYCCAKDITGKVPFEYSNYVFCSPTCLKTHRNTLKGKSWQNTWLLQYLNLSYFYSLIKQAVVTNIIITCTSKWMFSIHEYLLPCNYLVGYVIKFITYNNSSDN